MREVRAVGLSKFLLALTTIFWAALYASVPPASAAAGQTGCCIVAAGCFSPDTQTQCNARAVANIWKCGQKCNAARTACEVDPDPGICFCVDANGKKLRTAESPDECKKDKGESFKCFKRSEKAGFAGASLEACQAGESCSTCTVDVCRIVGTTSSSIVVEAQDNDGLAVIEILDSQNANTIVPPFSEGTTESVFVQSTKIDPTLGSRVSLLVIDAGCPCSGVRICDPVLTTVLRTTGKPSSESYSGLPQDEDTLTVFNSRPGLKHLDVIVNGTHFKVRGLTANEERTLDVSSAMLPGDVNIITLKTQGKPGSSATVLIWDGGQ